MCLFPFILASLFRGGVWTEREKLAEIGSLFVMNGFGDGFATIPMCAGRIETAVLAGTHISPALGARG